jgi:hypothetical protein
MLQFSSSSSSGAGGGGGILVLWGGKGEREDDGVYGGGMFSLDAAVARRFHLLVADQVEGKFLEEDNIESDDEDTR